MNKTPYDETMSLLRAAYLLGYRLAQSNRAFVAWQFDPEEDRQWCETRDAELRKLLGPM